MNDLLARCTAFLLEQRFDAYLVGGTVRDEMLARDSHDIDLTAPRGALQMARSLANHLGGAYYPLDAERETGRVVMPDRSTIDVSLWRGPDIDADLAARDFTINAMARRLAQPAILIDPLNGLRDLQHGLLRAVSEQCFVQDPARLLRAVRLAAELRLAIEPATYRLLERDAALIGEVAGERAREELLRIFERHDAAASVQTLAKLPLLAVILPRALPDETHLYVIERLARMASAFAGRSVSAPRLRPESASPLPAVASYAAESTSHGTEGAPLPLQSGSSSTVASPLLPESASHMPDVAPPTSDAASHVPESAQPSQLSLTPLESASIVAEFAPLLERDLTSDISAGHTNPVIVKLAALYDRPEAITADLGALRFRRDEIQYARELVAKRDMLRAHVLPISPLAAHRFFRDSGAGANHMGLVVSALAEEPPPPGLAALQEAVRALLTYYRDAYDQVIDPKPLLNGAELALRFGLRGRPIGNALRTLLEAQVAENVQTVEDAERYVARLASRP